VIPNLLTDHHSTLLVNSNIQNTVTDIPSKCRTSVIYMIFNTGQYLAICSFQVLVAVDL